MTDLQHEIDFSEVRSVLARETRAMIPQMVQNVTAQIQQNVLPYAGSVTGRRHRLIELAASAAISHFLDTVERPTSSSRSVDELFRRMGHGEATEGHDLEAMRAAFRIVGRTAWDELRTYATTRGWSATVLGLLSDALFSFVEHLWEQTRLGHDGASRVIEQDPDRARIRLTDGLLRGAPLADVYPDSVTAGWSIPERFVLIAMGPTADEPLPDLSEVTAGHLVQSDATSAIIVLHPDDRPDLLRRLYAHEDEVRVAASWPVTQEEIPDAARWTRRALELAARGVIPAAPVVYCSEHRTQLWLHSEPRLRQRLTQELLRPLLAETPNSREILSETLLAWLESRDSAPAIAAKLGVHPQTVRYRWKRINELFGEELRQPEFVAQATMLLKASVPLWKAGDQTDFERFRSEDVE